MAQTALNAKNHWDLLTAIKNAVDALVVGSLTGSYTDRSVAITLGGTSEQLVAANAARKHLIIQNPTSEIESLFVNFGAAATSTGNSIELTPGGQYTALSVQAIHVLAATTGHKVVAKELL